MKKENWSLGLSIVAIAISVVAICVAYPGGQLGFDYQGVIVGVLSLLVTILIGWQIYTFIDFNKKSKDIDNLYNVASKGSHKALALSSESNWMIYHYLLLKEDPLGIDFRFMYHGVSCLFHTSMLDDVVTCNIVVNSLLQIIARPEQIEIQESGKRSLITLLSGVNHKEKIERYNELLERVARIKIRDTRADK